VLFISENRFVFSAFLVGFFCMATEKLLFYPIHLLRSLNAPFNPLSTEDDMLTAECQVQCLVVQSDGHSERELLLLINFQGPTQLIRSGYVTVCVETWKSAEGSVRAHCWPTEGLIDWISPDFWCTGIPATCREQDVRRLGEGVGP